ncbi:MAG: hypothetical protein E7474_12185 [Ruminococcaceae bacterium]|nr:hypothetical protein [Oscillospiraceae bacterium]
MIRHTVNAVLLLRDGFSGRVFTDGSGTRCFLDGAPLRRPVWKKDGYLVLADLAPGDHELRISRSGYRDETVPLHAGRGELLEDTVELKPGAGYRFPPETVRVSLTLRRGKGEAANEHLWLGVPSRNRIKLAQEKSEAGDAEAHLFCEGNAALLPIPGHFLLCDKKAPELVYIRSLHTETAEFAPALQQAHGRGAELVAMQSYTADEAGTIQVLLREPGKLMGFCGGKVFEAELKAGEQSVEWKVEG